MTPPPLRLGRRALHILRAPSSGTLAHAPASDHVHNALEINSPANSSSVFFEVLGSPASLLKVSLPPSTPLYSRRNSLVATLGSFSSIVSTLHVARKPFTRILTGMPWCYQKIEATSPVSTLISCASRPNSSFAVLALDGTVDWIVTNSSALHTYSGELLSITPRRGWWTLGRLARRPNFPRFSHSFVSGRGTVALASTGQLYQITLGAGESFLAEKSSLVAYSQDSNNANASSPVPHRLPYTLHQPITSSSESAVVAPQRSALGYVTVFLSSVASAARKLGSWTVRSIRSDPGRYLELNGPTTLLIQSAVVGSVESLGHVVNQISQSQKDPNKSSLEREVQLIAADAVAESTRRASVTVTSGMPGKPEDHFKTATVQNGKVSFSSVKNFDAF